MIDLSFSQYMIYRFFGDIPTSINNSFRDLVGFAILFTSMLKMISALDSTTSIKIKDKNPAQDKKKI